MNTSNHAQARMQQRSLSPEILDLIVLLGSRVSEKSGADSIELEEKERKQLCKKIRHALRVLEKPGSPFVIVSEDDLVVTCAHPVKQRRRNKHRRASEDRRAA